MWCVPCYNVDPLLRVFQLPVGGGGGAVLVLSELESMASRQQREIAQQRRLLEQREARLAVLRGAQVSGFTYYIHQALLLLVPLSCAKRLPVSGDTRRLWPQGNGHCSLCWAFQDASFVNTGILQGLREASVGDFTGDMSQGRGKEVLSFFFIDVDARAVFSKLSLGWVSLAECVRYSVYELNANQIGAWRKSWELFAKYSMMRVTEIIRTWVGWWILWNYLECILSKMAVVIVLLSFLPSEQ